MKKIDLSERTKVLAGIVSTLTSGALTYSFAGWLCECSGGSCE